MHKMFAAAARMANGGQLELIVFTQFSSSSQKLSSNLQNITDRSNISQPTSMCWQHISLWQLFVIYLNTDAINGWSNFLLFIPPSTAYELQADTTEWFTKINFSQFLLCTEVTHTRTHAHIHTHARTHARTHKHNGYIYSIMLTKHQCLAQK